MHAEAFRFIERSIQAIPTPRSVIEIGSKNINGTPRTLLSPDIAYVGVDQVAGPDVDVVADGATYVPAKKADLVLCCEVLEHATNPEALMRNVVACAKRGGHVIVTCATIGRVPHSGIDGGALRRGEPYRNITPPELLSWLDRTRILVSEVDLGRGDLYVLAKVTK